MTALDRYAIRFIEPDGSKSQGPDCKNWGCAVLSISPFDRRPVEAIVINGTPHLLGQFVPAMDYLLQHKAVAEGIVAAIDARVTATLAAAPAAPAVEVDEAMVERALAVMFPSKHDDHLRRNWRETARNALAAALGREGGGNG
ncbi:hypothetical protein A7A76_20025 [Lysobacter enzymogenes]|uniref:hypothetical protein n=1 Tax=Lysobacter enzymogenes TaxID=69 RepID=UPI0019D24478|nr:hypothetical protein [Lysobacter enzymogenes]MBN7137029.1 hypothetical protein [Lysobacter enzymogenes]